MVLHKSIQVKVKNFNIISAPITDHFLHSKHFGVITFLLYIMITSNLSPLIFTKEVAQNMHIPPSFTITAAENNCHFQKGLTHKRRN